MEKFITVHTIPNNLPRRRPRRPLVQIMDNVAGTGSITFHPRHTPHIVRAIKAAAKASAAGRRLRSVIIDVSEQEPE